jgi:hypothetical protein
MQLTRKTLEAHTWPAHTELRSSRSAVAKSTTMVRKSEGFELLSQKCSICGKPDSEIRRAWEEGSFVDAETRRKNLEELKKLGFSGVIRG